MRIELPTEIFKKDLELKQDGFDWRKAYLMVSKSVEDRTGTVIRDGNTLFWLIYGLPHRGTLSVINADSNNNLMKNFQHCLLGLQVGKYELINLYTNNVNLFHAAEKFGYKVEFKKNKKSKNAYSGLIYLGEM